MQYNRNRRERKSLYSSFKIRGQSEALVTLQVELAQKLMRRRCMYTSRKSQFFFTYQLRGRGMQEACRRYVATKVIETTFIRYRRYAASAKVAQLNIWKQLRMHSSVNESKNTQLVLLEGDKILLISSTGKPNLITYDPHGCG